MSVKISFENGSQSYQLEHWFVGEGVAVTKGQDLAMIRTDTTLKVLTSPMSGIFLAKRIANGDSFAAGSTIGLIVSHEEAGGLKVTDKLTAQDRRILDSLHNVNEPTSKLRQPIHVKATPSARRLARENGLNLRDIEGTGPDGRIHLRDVHAYMSRADRKEVTKIDKKPVYNLPLTPLAEHMVREHGLDASLIPAPPGATRLRKRDVERYLKDPEGAAQSLEDRETEPSSDLIQELDSFEQAVQIEPEVLETETVQESILQLDITETLQLEEESGYIAEPIRLSTAEPASAPSGETILLGEEKKPAKRESVETVDTISASVLETPTARKETTDQAQVTKPEVTSQVEAEKREPVEMVDTASTSVSETPTAREETTDQAQETTPEVISKVESDQSEPGGDRRATGSEAPVVVKRSAHLSNVVTLDLKKIDLDKIKSGQSILDFIRDILLETIVKSLAGQVENITYQPSLKDDTLYQISYTDGTLKKDKVESSGAFLVVDLLGLNCVSVSGLLNTENRALLYFSYVCQLSDFLDNVDASKSLLGLTLDYDTEVLSAQKAFKILDTVTAAIRNIGENSDEK